MRSAPQHTLLLAYRHIDTDLSFKISLENLLIKYDKTDKIRIKLVNYDKDTALCNKYGIAGTPALLLLSDGRLRGRFLGEISIQDLEQIIKNL